MALKNHHHLVYVTEKFGKENPHNYYYYSYNPELFSTSYIFPRIVCRLQKDSALPKAFLGAL